MQDPTLKQEVAETVILTISGILVSMVITQTGFVIAAFAKAGLHDLLIVFTVLFTVLLMTTWEGIHYLSNNSRMRLLVLLSGRDTLVCNAEIGPNIGLLVRPGKQLIANNVWIKGMDCGIRIETYHDNINTSNLITNTAIDMRG